MISIYQLTKNNKNYAKSAKLRHLSTISQKNGQYNINKNRKHFCILHKVTLSSIMWDIFIINEKNMSYHNFSCIKALLDSVGWNLRINFYTLNEIKNYYSTPFFFLSTPFNSHDTYRATLYDSPSHVLSLLHLNL